MPRFTAGLNIYSWLDNFERYLRLNEDFISNKIDTLLFHIGESVQQTLEGIEYDRDQETAYQQLKQMLTKLYGNKEKPTSAWKSQFQNRMQEPNESVHLFVNSLRKIAKNAFPDIPNETLEDYIKDQIINGLRNKDARKQLIINKIHRLKDVIEIAEAHEEAENYLNEQPKPIDLQTLDRQQQTQEQNADNTRYRNTYNNNQNYRSQDITCYKCGGKGHMARLCQVQQTQANSQNNRNSQNDTTNLLPPQPPVQAISVILKPREIRGTCRMNDTIVEFVTDTGACRTIIDESTLNLIKGSLLENNTRNFRTADGYQIETLGFTRVKLQIDKYQCYTEVLVVKKLVNNCLLGMDILHSCPLISETIKKLNTQISGTLKIRNIDTTNTQRETQVIDIETQTGETSTNPITTA